LLLRAPSKCWAKRRKGVGQECTQYIFGSCFCLWPLEAPISQLQITKFPTQKSLRMTTLIIWSTKKPCEFN
jgi:hypothetical protein